MAIETFNLNDSGATIKDNLNANFADLDTTKADLASPTFTGAPVLPTGTTGITQSTGDNSTKIATTEYVSNQITASGNTITIETTAGATHSLTTTAGQKVIVWAKGWCNDSSVSVATLTYNVTEKDRVELSPSASGNRSPFSLMYTETPGAGTQNITLACNAGSVQAPVIIVMKQG
jgi:hypothetical protein